MKIIKEKIIGLAVWMLVMSNKLNYQNNMK